MRRILLVISLVASFGSSITQAEPATVRIGATLALTGKLATTGASQQAGLELAIADINSSGGISGKKLELIVEDNLGDQKAALQGVNKLLDADEIDFLFSSFSHITQAIKDRVKRAHKVMIYAASLGDIARDNPHFFRDWGDVESQGRSLLREAKKLGYKSVGILAEESEGCVALLKSFRGLAAELEVVIKAEETYQPGETDFRSTLIRLKQKQPEALAFCTWRDSGVIMKQFKNLGLIATPTIHFLAPMVPESDTPEVRALYEENKTRVIWLGFVEGELTPNQQAFFKRLREEKGISPRIEAALAYDDLIVLATAANKCKSLEPECVTRRLMETKHEGVAGPLAFDSSRRSTRPDVIIQVKNGAWHSVQ